MTRARVSTDPLYGSMAHFPFVQVLERAREGVEQVE
jgi:hypothetical protein